MPGASSPRRGDETSLVTCDELVGSGPRRGKERNPAPDPDPVRWVCIQRETGPANVSMRAARRSAGGEGRSGVRIGGPARPRRRSASRTDRVQSNRPNRSHRGALTHVRAPLRLLPGPRMTTAAFPGGEPRYPGKRALIPYVPSNRSRQLFDLRFGATSRQRAPRSSSKTHIIVC